MGLVVEAVEALDDRLLHLLDGVDGLAGIGVNLQYALVVKLHLEVLRPTAITAKPARLGADGFLSRSFHAFIMATAAVLALGGCSLGGDEEPEPATGAAREIGELVRQLERATAARDYAAICNDLFTEAARERAGGSDCVRLLRSGAQGVRRPRIEVRRIEIEGERATVRVRTRA